MADYELKYPTESIVSLLDTRPVRVFPRVDSKTPSLNVFHFDAIAYRGLSGKDGKDGINGKDGANAIPGIVYKGIYSSTETYAVGDVVTATNGNAYVCRLDGTLNIPPNVDFTPNANWSPFVAKGADGPAGVPGQIGPEGKSAYEIEVEQGTFTGTIQEWADQWVKQRAHIVNTDIHVTTDDKDRWNSALAPILTNNLPINYLYSLNKRWINILGLSAYRAQNAGIGEVMYKLAFEVDFRFLSNGAAPDLRAMYSIVVSGSTYAGKGVETVSVVKVFDEIGISWSTTASKTIFPDSDLPNAEFNIISAYLDRNLFPTGYTTGVMSTAIRRSYRERSNPDGGNLRYNDDFISYFYANRTREFQAYTTASALTFETAFGGGGTGSVEEVKVGNIQPTSSDVKIWVKTVTDLDILRQIRDANPTSQLPSLWLDSEDPYTQWWDAGNELGVLFGGDSRLDQFALEANINIPPIEERNPLKAYALALIGCGITTLNQVDKLSLLCYLDVENNQVTTLNVANMKFMQLLSCPINQLTTLYINGLTSLLYLYIRTNQLNAIDTLTSKGSILNYDFRYNNFSTAELDRFRSMEFTDDTFLLPQNP